MSHNGDPSSSSGRRAPSGRAQPGRPVTSGPGTGSRGLRIFRWIAAGLAICLAIGSIAAYLKFRSVWDSITRVSAHRAGRRAAETYHAMNVLVIGSD